MDTQVKMGKLKQYVNTIGKPKQGCKPPKSKRKWKRSRSPDDNQKRRVVNVIFGGGSVGQSRSYARKVMHTTTKAESKKKHT